MQPDKNKRKDPKRPICKITRNDINMAMKEYFSRGGKITLFTEEDIKKRDIFLGGIAGIESCEFLNGD
jgi:hypothetical protein